MRHTISLGFFVALAALTVGLRTPAEAGYYTPGTASVELRRIAALEVPDAGRTIDECMLYLYEAFDLQEIEIASVTTDDLQGHGSSERPALNANGSIVAFESDAPELTGEPGMGRRGQVMIRNRATRTTRLMSARGANASAPGDGESEEPSISADGERVAFSSNATDLLLPALVLKGEGDPGPSHAFLRSVPGSTTVQADVADDATPADSEGGFAVISADGDHVAFLSLAANLVAGDTNGGGGDPFLGADVFVRHVALGLTERASLSNDGSQAPGPHGLFSYDLPDALCDFQPPPCQEFFTGVAMSADGTQVAFSSVSSALVAGDGNQSGDPQSGSDVFVRDLTEGSTTRVSVASDGSEANGPSFGAAMSADGRYVAFASFATNLVPDDTNAGAVPSDQTDDTELARFAGLDVFVRDRVGGTTERVSVADDGAQANGPSGLFIER
ncbi:MAG: PD40 domain-containing protein, partial [Myxococcales bacterium]|nr:PD40 domain-containing protein [Myxococcales bacterium]